MDTRMDNGTVLIDREFKLSWERDGFYLVVMFDNNHPFIRSYCVYQYLHPSIHPSISLLYDPNNGQHQQIN